MNKIKKLIKSYEEWVAANPETVCDVETTTKWVSYFIAGRISDSNVVSELIYSLSNMLVLYNDRIIARTRRSSVNTPTETADSSGICYRLKVILTTLEYSEVFIEISAKRVFGTKGKWIFIALLQTVKAAGRFFILKHSTEQIITSPAMPSLNRRNLIKQRKVGDISGANGSVITAGNTFGKNKTLLEEQSFTFHLKRSGRLLRKVEGSPPIQFRDFKLYSETSKDLISTVPRALLQAEYLYISKPLIHLAAMGIFGEKRWKQYVVALALDLISIRLYHKNRHLMTEEQKLEMSRRCVNLILYMMRSPFYDRFTKSRLERVLGFVANNIPIAKLIAAPLREYIPHWQNTYFYLWST